MALSIDKVTQYRSTLTSCLKPSPPDHSSSEKALAGSMLLERSRSVAWRFSCNESKSPSYHKGEPSAGWIRNPVLIARSVYSSSTKVGKLRQVGPWASEYTVVNRLVGARGLKLPPPMRARGLKLLPPPFPLNYPLASSWGALGSALDPLLASQPLCLKHLWSYFKGDFADELPYSKIRGWQRVGAQKADIERTLKSAWYLNQGFFWVVLRHVSSVFHGSRALKNAGKTPETPWFKNQGIPRGFQGFSWSKRAFANAPFCATTRMSCGF